MPFTSDEIKILAMSPAAIQALIDHYDNEESSFEAGDAADVAKPLERRRLQLEKALRDGLKTPVPSAASIPAPTRVDTPVQFAAFDMQLAQLAATDPGQALCNARWMLDQQWWQRLSLENAIRRIDHIASPRVQELDAGWFMDAIHEMRQSDPHAGMFPASTDEQLAAALSAAIADHFGSEMTAEGDVLSERAKPTGDHPTCGSGAATKEEVSAALAFIDWQNGDSDGQGARSQAVDDLLKAAVILRDALKNRPAVPANIVSKLKRIREMVASYDAMEVGAIDRRNISTNDWKLMLDLAELGAGSIPIDALRVARSSAAEKTGAPEVIDVTWEAPSL